MKRPIDVAALVSSLRFRLLISLLCVFALGAVAMLGVMRAASRSAHDAVEEKSLQSQALDLLAGLRLDGQGRFVALRVPKRWRAAYRTSQAAFFTLYDGQGHIVAQSRNLGAPLAPIPDLTMGLSSLRVVGPSENLVLGAAGPQGFQLVVARTSPGRFAQAHPDFWEDVAPAVLFCLFAALGVAAAWGVTLFSLRPLLRASAEAATIGPDAPSVRLTQAGLPTEARPLVRAVNAALDRVAAAYEGEKRFTADAAHALRTPLAVLDLRLQQAQRDGEADWPGVRRDLAEIARLVTGLLSLSRAERGGREAREAVNLARLAREVAAAFAPRLEALGRDIDVSAPGDAPLTCNDAGALRDTIAALVDNALTHGRGRVTMMVETHHHDMQVLRVCDEGGGVATGQAEAVFQRFHKLDANSPGAGLGLAIARQTARSQGGDVCWNGPGAIEIRMPK